MINEVFSVQNLYLFFCVFAAYFIKAITGFGNTLIMSPLFSFVVPNSVTTPVDLLMSLPANCYIAWRERRDISAKIAAPPSLLLTAGIIPGIFFLKISPGWILKSILGLVVVAIAVEMLLQKQNADGKPANRVLLAVTGIMSGVLAGIFGISVLITVYVRKSTINKSGFRSNICFVFLVENLIRLILYVVTGIFTRDVLILSLRLFPAMALGMLCGSVADRFIGEKEMRIITIVLLIASGSVLFFTNAVFR